MITLEALASIFAASDATTPSFGEDLNVDCAGSPSLELLSLLLVVAVDWAEAREDMIFARHSSYSEMGQRLQML